jgi:hypothetical protein
VIIHIEGLDELAALCTPEELDQIAECLEDAAEIVKTRAREKRETPEAA